MQAALVFFIIYTRAYIKMQIASLRSLDRLECACADNVAQKSEQNALLYHTLAT